MPIVFLDNQNQEELQKAIEALPNFEPALDGVSPVVAVTETETGHMVSITDVNGKKTFEVKNGEDGYSPIKGVDYWTDADKEAINAESINFMTIELAKKNQLQPEYVDSIEDCTDTSKVYVLSDGYIYGYMNKEETIVIPGETIPGQAALVEKNRWSGSGKAFSGITACSTVFVPVKGKSVPFTINLVNMTANSTYINVYGGSPTPTDATEYGTRATDGKSVTVNKAVDCVVFMVDRAATSTTTEYDNAKFVIGDEEIGIKISTTTDYVNNVIQASKTEGKTETITTEGFSNTGHAFVPIDYEDRIVDLEDDTENIKKSVVSNTEHINILESEVEAIPELEERTSTLENRIQTLEDEANDTPTIDENSPIHNAIGTTFPPSQKPANADIDGYDIDVLNATSDDIYTYIDNVVSNKETVTKEILGKDASDKYDIVRYIYANREHCAWVRENYPKMYAWKNGTTKVYTESVSPRVGETAYSVPYISGSGTAISEVRVATVAEGATTNNIPSSRIIGGVEYVRSEADDVNPTVIYTDMDDERNSNTSITQDGIVYNRYPLGDLGANRTKLIPIFIYANEHGIKPSRLNESDSMYLKYESKMCALVASRFLRDLADGKQIKNPLYKFIREKCMLIIIPVANPFGYNMNVTGDTNSGTDGYYNVNNVNINRNYDTSGWIVSNTPKQSTHGQYPGSENETQYIMNTMVESGAVVAMSLHGIGGHFGVWDEPELGTGICAHQGQNPDGSHYDKDTMKKISDFLTENYGYKMVFYDRREEDHKVDFEQPNGESINLPDRACKSPSYITYCGAYGGIIEFQPDDIHVSGYQHNYKSYIIENAYAQAINLTAAFLSDYLDNV